MESFEPFTKHTDQSHEHRDITPTEEQLLAMALANLGEYITEHSPKYVLIEDPRNQDDYDTWDVGMEPIPGDQTWKSTAIDVKSSEVK
jgi:hypothetical protein